MWFINPQLELKQVHTTGAVCSYVSLMFSDKILRDVYLRISRSQTNTPACFLVTRVIIDDQPIRLHGPLSAVRQSNPDMGHIPLWARAQR